MPDDERFTVHTASWFGMTELASVADMVLFLPVGSTATVFRGGFGNNDPAGSCAVTRYLDGYTVRSAATPEPSWVSTLRQLITDTTDALAQIRPPASPADD